MNELLGLLHIDRPMIQSRDVTWYLYLDGTRRRRGGLSGFLESCAMTRHFCSLGFFFVTEMTHVLFGSGRFRHVACCTIHTIKELKIFLILYVIKYTLNIVLLEDGSTTGQGVRFRLGRGRAVSVESFLVPK